MFSLLSIAERTVKVLFPPACGVCRSVEIADEVPRLCVPCRRSIQPVESVPCSICGRWAETDVADLDPPSFTCGECRLHPPPFDRAFSYRPYREPLSQLIHRYKYQGQYWLSEDLLSLCRDRLEEVVEWTRPQWIVPVPLHKRKLRARRFDQSFLLARGISKRFGVPMADRFLVRTRNTRQQTRLNHEERFQNVRGAFEVADRKGFPKKSRMLLVDDVMTTGATVRECSRILKRAGAGEVFVFTVARA